MKSEIEKQLNELAQKAFESHSWNFWPLFPNVLVRVFDFEEATTSRIIKPQTAQSPNHRAIVIRTWREKIIYPDPYGKYDAIHIRSELNEGDIVTIPYYAGVPTGVENIDDAGYRVIPENKVRDWKTGRVISLGSSQEIPHIFFTQSMYDKRAVARTVLQLGDSWSEMSWSDKEMELNIDKLLEDFDIVPKRLSLAQTQGEVASTTT